jgi:hypothetical protein
VNNELSKAGQDGVQRWLDRAEVLDATVEQLRKDLGMTPDELPVPPFGDAAFEELRALVLTRLTALHDRGLSTLQVALYRVDIPEAHMRRTMASGGLHALAGECVLRALQKVLTRMRFAGRY